MGEMWISLGSEQDSGEREKLKIQETGLLKERVAEGLREERLGFQE